MKIISIEDNIKLPKYKQIVSSIEKAISSGELKKGEILPSINAIKNEFSLSRDTVLMAFNELKTRGVIESVVGKGYYLKSENIEVAQKVFLLFDELNAFKEDLYNSFLSNLDDTIQVDIFFHHFNYEVFSKLIYDHIGSYSYYIIMPANLNETDKVIDKLPQDKVYILDQMHDELKQYPGIYQNFEDDICNSLTKAIHLLKNYKKNVLLFPEKKQPQGMLTGFQKFIKNTNFNHEVISSLEGRNIEKGEVYVLLDDISVIVLIKKMKEQNLVLGKDVGIISYNETLFKEVVEGGITTISTDFKYMGKRLADMIINKEKGHIKNPNKLIIRNSL